MIKVYSLVIGILFFSSLSLAQVQVVEDEYSGQYPSRFFGPEEYQGGLSNLCFVQDHEGNMYIGNANGVLIYNGARWKSVSLSNQSEALWLTIDKNQQVFVAGHDEFGKLNNSNGQFTYESLVSHLPDTIQGFGSIWEVESTSYGTYFRTSRYLFWYQEGAVEVISKDEFPGTTFDVIFAVNDTLHTRKRRAGIGKVVGREFELLKGGEFFAKIKTNAILKLGSKILVATRAHGLYVLDEHGVSEFINDVNDDLIKAKIYHATANDDYIALATLTGGVFIIDHDGVLLEHINQEKYNINESTSYVFFDAQKGLWIASAKGILRVDFNNRFRLFDQVADENTRINGMLKKDDVYYFVTSTGAYYSKNRDFKEAQKIQDIDNPCRHLRLVDDSLFFDANDGTYAIAEDFSATKAIQIRGTLFKRELGNSYFLGGQEGLTAVKRNSSGEFEVLQKYEVGNNIISLYEFEPNKLWLCPLFNGITYFDLTTDSIKNFSEFGDTRIIEIDHKPIFVTDNGVFELINDEFKMSPFFYNLIDSTRFEIFSITKDDSENLLIIYHNERQDVYGKWLKKESQGEYTEFTLPDFDLTMYNFSRVYLANDGELWIAKNDEMLLINILEPDISPYDFNAKITEIKIGNSLINPNLGKLQFTENSVSFEYTGLYYNSYGGNTYQYQLLGLEDDWSEWSENHKKEYSYLKAGDYTFSVRAQNANKALSQVASVTFSILPPWYQRTWAYVLYVLLIIFVIIIVARVRSIRLQKENKKLEQLVSERTAEVASKNQKLNEINVLKSQFFANISHELRTPLTLINGQLESLEFSKSSFDIKARLESTRRNVGQLGNMIEDLLDLSKLELGQNKVKLISTKVNAILSRMVSTFQSFSESKQIELTYIDEFKESVYARLDTAQFEKVINNLLYNAFKFTSIKGHVSVRSRATEDSIIIEISDTGNGISEKELPYIFDRFYQAKNQGQEGGSGLGLAISKEIVLLHNGKIEVESAANKGTTFVITLPRSYDIDDYEENEEAFSLDDFLSKNIFLGELSRPHILIVEDNNEMQNYLQEILEDTFSLHCVSNGFEALEWLKFNSTQLVISDVMMPKMTGFELLKELKTSVSLRNVPVILLTARSAQEDRMEGLRYGVDDYITKPFNREELLVRAINLVKNLQARVATAKEIGTTDDEVEPKNSISQDDEKLIKEAELFIESRISDSSLSVREVAMSVAMSERQFYRKVRQITGMTPSRLMMEIRLCHAQKLLIQGEIVKLSQLSSEIGINSASYFSKLFYERFGRKPSSYISK